MDIKKFLLVLILNSSFLVVNCYSQQYGWVDISSNLPPSNGTASLSDLHFIRDDEGWICSGALGEIYHTTDGAQTFTTQTTQYSTNAIYMLNSLVGYAGGQQGRIYKTTDGGTNWVVHGSIGSALLDIDFPPISDSGYCCGYNGKIYKITSSGINAMGSGVTENLSSISFPSSGLGWTCGGSLIINYNGSWSQQDPPVESYNGIFMINENTGWVVGALGVIVNTSDGGTNWHNYQINPDSSNRSLNNVFFLVVNEGWAVGNSGVVLHTTNGGITWNIILDGWTSNMLRSVQFTSPTNGYILGNNKTLFKYGLLTYVEQQPTPPTAFKLEQNYPNPFNPSTIIQYAIPQNVRGETQEVSLKVYDVLGNEIATLVDEYKPSGIYNVQFTMNNLSSGIYFYQIRSGDFIQTKKMIFMK
jgi:photosystem II stability/assembly factor-like uncharacterized protein